MLSYIEHIQSSRAYFFIAFYKQPIKQCLEISETCKLNTQQAITVPFPGTSAYQFLAPFDLFLHREPYVYICRRIIRKMTWLLQTLRSRRKRNTRSLSTVFCLPGVLPPVNLFHPVPSVHQKEITRLRWPGAMKHHLAHYPSQSHFTTSISELPGSKVASSYQSLQVAYWQYQHCGVSPSEGQAERTQVRRDNC